MACAPISARRHAREGAEGCSAWYRERDAHPATLRMLPRRTRRQNNSRCGHGSTRPRDPRRRPGLGLEPEHLRRQHRHLPWGGPRRLSLPCWAGDRGANSAARPNKGVRGAGGVGHPRLIKPALLFEPGQTVGWAGGVGWGAMRRPGFAYKSSRQHGSPESSGRLLLTTYQQMQIRVSSRELLAASASRKVRPPPTPPPPFGFA